MSPAPRFRKENYRRADCIAMLVAFFLKHGRAPYHDECYRNPKLPTPDRLRQLFGSFSAGLSAAGLPVRKQLFTAEELLDKLRMFILRYKRLPKQREYRNGEVPDARRYARNWGTLEDAAVATGVWEKRVVPSKNDFIRQVSDIAVELGRTPTLVQLKEKGFPLGLALKEFGSHQALIRATGLQPNRKGTAYSDDALLQILRDLFVSLGRVPMTKDFLNSAGLPDPRVFAKHFGSFDRALELADIACVRDHVLWRRWQRLVGKIVGALYGECQTNKVPHIDGLVDFHVPSRRLIIDAMTSSYRKESKEGQVHRYTANGDRLEFWCLAEVAGMEYDHPLLKYVYPKEIEHRIRNSKAITLPVKKRLINELTRQASEERGTYTRIELLDLLRAFHRRIGRVPSYREFKRHPEMPSTTTYSLNFGTVRNALIQAGIDPMRNFSRDQAIAFIHVLARDLGRTPTVNDIKEKLGFTHRRLSGPFGGSYNALISAAKLSLNNRLDWSKTCVITAFTRWVSENGRIPGNRDWQTAGEYFPSRSVPIRLFGSWRNFVQAAKSTMP